MFYKEDGRGMDVFDDVPFLVTALVDSYKVCRALIDNGSTVNILFVSPYEKLERPERKLILDHEPFLSFSGDITQPFGSD